jgi:PAS domain S-box-containing protein
VYTTGGRAAMKLRSYLVVFAVLTVLPVVLFATGLVGWNASVQRELSVRALTETTRALSLAVDREIGKAEALLTALAASPLIDAGDFPSLHRHASRLGAGGWITIITPDGEQLLNTLLPFGAPVPRAANVQRLREIVETRRMNVSNLYVGALAKRPIVSIGVPVIRHGAGLYSMDIAFGPERFTDLLREQRMPEGWLATILDRKGIIIARTWDPEKHVGQPGTADFVDRIMRDTEGLTGGVTREGVPVYGAWTRSALSGWTVNVAVAQTLVEAPLRRQFWGVATGGAAFLTLGVLLALTFGRRIARPITALAESANALGRGDDVRATPVSRIAEVCDVQRALALASTVAQERAAERHRRLSAERARAEAEAVERQFRELADAMPQIVWAARPDGDVDYHNRRWHQLADVGEERGEDAWLQRIHPDDRRRHVDRWNECVRTGRPFEIEYRVKPPATDAFRWYLVRALPVRDEHGDIVRWYGTSTDIHDLKTAQQELAAAKVSAERAKLAAEDANRAKDHFLAVLSHELRTPLTPVLTGIALLEKEVALSDRGRRYLEVLRRNVTLEARLIDDLLDLTRIVRGRVDLDRRPVELCTVIERAVEVCRADIETRRLHFGIDWGPRPYLIDADATRLQQVLWNLLKNAIKFTPLGGCVGVRCRRRDGDVVVEVNDSGIGIEPAALETIFDAFAQSPPSTARQFGGLGLGLAISKALVEMHGGRIAATSDGPGTGATFTIRLPLATADTARTTGTEAAPAGGPAPAGRPPLRILLVEDHGDTSETIVSVLELEGHHVETAGDVQTALNAASRETFDVLVSDLGLPDASGLDLMRRLRATGQRLPAIALSGYGQEHDVKASRDAGFHMHLVKPIEPDRLLWAIDTVVSSGEAPR